MSFGISGSGYIEIRNTAQPGDQISGIAIALRMGLKRCAYGGHIASQGDHLGNARGSPRMRDLVDCVT